MGNTFRKCVVGVIDLFMYELIYLGSSQVIEFDYVLSISSRDSQSKHGIYLSGSYILVVFKVKPKTKTKP